MMYLLFTLSMAFVTVLLGISFIANQNLQNDLKNNKARLQHKL